METQTVQFSISQKVKEVLADFIEASAVRFVKQIADQREYFKKWNNKEVEAGDYPLDNWFYRSPYGSAYHKLDDGLEDYSKPMRRFTKWALTKAGYNYSMTLRLPDAKLIEQYKEDLIGKIVKALNKHNATEFTPIQVQSSSLGIEGTYFIGEGRTATFSAISAGGYNIQCFHYRYTVKINK